MSDHGSGGGGGSCFLTLGFISIPAVAITEALYKKNLIEQYGRPELIPAAALENLQNLHIILGIVLVFCLCVLFPLGVNALIKTHFGGH